jgi:imidazoleglycerol phosphate dehydratase HisB/imidazoleglycerol phosphate synthase glutamine amidotransferase subunit HisH
VVQRNTKETKIRVELDLDRAGDARIATGLPFFDHMLEQIGKHGGFALDIQAEGDLHIDEHHTIEDTGLALGQALREALGDKRGIGRYGFTLPMDETLASAALDFSGRPYFVFEGEFKRERVGDMPTELVPHFFRSLCDASGLNLNLQVRGDNDHHKVEACFKALARACVRRWPAGHGTAEHQGGVVSDVALIDAGGANLGSVRYALERLGATVRLVRDADGLVGAQRVILPGVGAAGPGMQRLHAQGLVEPLQRLEVPLMGICLGMQLLFERPRVWRHWADSRRGAQAGAGLRHPRAAHGLEPPAAAARIAAAARRAGTRQRLLRAQLCGALNTHTVAACDHGGLFTAVVEQGRYYGAQFHPERSGETGSLMLRNFLEGTAA